MVRQFGVALRLRELHSVASQGLQYSPLEQYLRLLQLHSVASQDLQYSSVVQPNDCHSYDANEILVDVD
ncbi:MAG: hypothetical protein ACREBR_00045 [bacterium]